MQIFLRNHFAFFSINSLRHNFLIKNLSYSKPRAGLAEFFENGESLPFRDPSVPPKVIGRAWSTNELRQKSFEDLHKLWFILLKEMNMLYTQAAEAKRLSQQWFGKTRIIKCRQSMSRIKTVLTERRDLHEKSVELIKCDKPKSEGEILVEIQKRDKMKQLWRKRHFRKAMNFKEGRRPLFV